MNIRAGHYDHFEGDLEMVNRGMLNQFSLVGKLACVRVVGKMRGEK